MAYRYDRDLKFFQYLESSELNQRV
ncbi:DUF3944 domain-containing protein [Hydrogenimonas thermophila]